MATAAKPVPARTIRARVTSKGQVTIPAGMRKLLGIKPGDEVRLDVHQGRIGVEHESSIERESVAAPESRENVFEKWRGIGNYPGMGDGREAIVGYFREMRGHDDFD